MTQAVEASEQTRTEALERDVELHVDELLAEHRDSEVIDERAAQLLAQKGTISLIFDPSRRLRINLSKNTKGFNHDSTIELESNIPLARLEHEGDRLDEVACRLIVRGIARREAIDRGEFSADVANVAAQVHTAPAPVVEDIKDLPF